MIFDITIIIIIFFIYIFSEGVCVLDLSHPSVVEYPRSSLEIMEKGIKGKMRDWKFFFFFFGISADPVMKTIFLYNFFFNSDIFFFLFFIRVFGVFCRVAISPTKLTLLTILCNAISATLMNSLCKFSFFFFFFCF